MPLNRKKHSFIRKKAHLIPWLRKKCPKLVICTCMKKIQYENTLFCQPNLTKLPLRAAVLFWHSSMSPRWVPTPPPTIFSTQSQASSVLKMCCDFSADQVSVHFYTDPADRQCLCTGNKSRLSRNKKLSDALFDAWPTAFTFWLGGSTNSVWEGKGCIKSRPKIFGPEAYLVQTISNQAYPAYASAKGSVKKQESRTNQSYNQKSKNA